MIGSVKRILRDRLSTESKLALANAYIKAIRNPMREAQMAWRRRVAFNDIPFRPNNRDWRSTIQVREYETIKNGISSYTYRGIGCHKYPFDMALYTLLIQNVKPRTIIELGSYHGGGALWFSDVLRTFVPDGHVYTVDINKPEIPFPTPNVTYIEGDSSNLATVFSSAFLGNLPRPLFVIDDASHLYSHVLSSLRFFDPWIRPGEYIAVEDGVLTDFGRDLQFQGGPGRAISEFLRDTDGRYEIDAAYCDHFGHNHTFNANGYLKRVR